MGAHLLAVAAKGVDDGLRRCRVLWSAASHVLLGVIASVLPMGGVRWGDQDSVYNQDVYRY